MRVTACARRILLRVTSAEESKLAEVLLRVGGRLDGLLMLATIFCGWQGRLLGAFFSVYRGAGWLGVSEFFKGSMDGTCFFDHGIA